MARLQVAASIVGLGVLLPLLLAGCAGPAPARAPAEPGYWAVAGPGHPGRLDLRAEGWTLEGNLSLAAAPRTWEIIQPGPSDLLLFQNATVEGRRGTVAAPLGGGLRLTVLQGTFSPHVPRVDADGDGLRVVLESRPMDLQYVACAPGEEPGFCVPPERVPLDLPQWAYAGFPGPSQYALAFPDVVRLEGDGLVFHDADGSTRTLGRSVQMHHVYAILTAGDRTDLRLPLAPGTAFSSAERLTVWAKGAQGEVRIHQTAHPVEDDEVYAVLAKTGGFTLPADEEGLRPLQVHGGLRHLVSGGFARIEARVASVPNVLEVSGAPGEEKLVQAVLVESSRGADARDLSVRVEGPAQAGLVRVDPYPATRELLEMAQAAEGGPVTAPMALAVGIVLPFVALAEALGSLFQSAERELAEPLHAGGSRIVAFRVKVPDAASETAIVFSGSNVEDSALTLRFRPTG